MFEVMRSEVGHAKLKDGTVLYMRVSITGVKEIERLPVGFTLAVAQQITIWAESPEELKHRVKDTPNPPKTGEHLKNWSIWNLIDIIESKPSIEEIHYRGSDDIIYRISLEIEPTIVSQTLEYRDQDNNPIYYTRWSDKMSTHIEKG